MPFMVGTRTRVALLKNSAGIFPLKLCVFTRERFWRTRRFDKRPRCGDATYTHRAQPYAISPRTWHSATLAVADESMNLVVDTSFGESVPPWMMREVNVSSWLADLR